MKFFIINLLSCLLFSGALYASIPKSLLNIIQETIPSYISQYNIVKEKKYLTKLELKKVQQIAGTNIPIVSRFLIRYKVLHHKKIMYYVYIDTHRVRTLEETALFVIKPEGTIEKIEIISFQEPQEYYPYKEWRETLYNIPLSNKFYIQHKIPKITGATLTSYAITHASRRILSYHKIVK